MYFIFHDFYDSDKTRGQNFFGEMHREFGEIKIPKFVYKLSPLRRERVTSAIYV